MEECELNALIERSYDRIVRAAMVLCGNCADAEDLAQETFLQAVKARESFVGRSLPDTWLYAILLNNHRKQQRSVARRWKRMVTWFHEQPQPESIDAAQRSEEIEWQDSLWASVATLAKPQQDAIVLRYSEGLSYDEIATILKCPIGTVRSRLHHGLKSLRQRLEHSPQLSVWLEAERS